MAVIAHQNTHIAPYWGKHVNIKAGLNQLGIRNITEQMYATLLPGLNNVSARIRYYSFYCWIIRKFYEGRKKADEKSFKEYIRRAEFLLALINTTLDNPTGVPGINRALTRKAANDSIILQKEIYNEDGSTRDTYWANPGGVLTQYYIASLIDMGIIGRNEKNGALYNVSKKGDFITGDKLADAFEKSVANSSKLFLDFLASPLEIKISDLEPLKANFDMKSFPTEGEQNLLIELLLQKDFPGEELNSSIHRRTTIKLLLECIKANPKKISGQSFSEYIYNNYIPDCSDLTCWGWYSYYLDDQWQYWATLIFVEILEKLKSKITSVAIDDFTNEITGDIATVLDCGDCTLGMYIQQLNKVNDSNSLTEALTSLLLLYKHNIKHHETSSSNYGVLGLTDDNFCDFETLIETWKNHKMSSFIKHYLTQEIIYRHYRISFRKLHQTGLATQKLIIEDGRLRFIDTWFTTFTSPRIDTLKLFLQDLRIIDVVDESTLKTTPLGEALLIRLQNEYAEKDS